MNIKEPELVGRFLELRAQGWTFARIAAEINVSKPTLIAWSRKYQHLLHNLRALTLEAWADECRVSRRACMENLAEDLRRIREEIARRDLTDIPTARLLILAARLRAEANHLNGPVRLSESCDAIPSEESQHLEPAVDWEG